MTPLAALAAAGLAWRMAVAAAPPEPPQDLHLEGDVTYQPGSGLLLVENGAVLRRGAVTVRARSATYDPATGEVRAAGGVLLTDPTRVVQADGVRAVLGGQWEAEGVVAFLKEVPVDLASAETVEAARARGRNRLSFSGSHLAGDAAGRFQLEGARLTLCDCPGGGAPSWEVTSRKADVIPGKRAILSWPVLRITPRFLLVDRPVPILVLPWLYLPLGDRQTGLLLPQFRRTSQEGLTLGQPLFVTLGRSADATLTPEYAFGLSKAPTDVSPQVRGPGARLELRWAPAVRSEGRIELAWLRDLAAEPGGESGDRLAIAGTHTQRAGEATTLNASLQLAGDPVWVRDHSSDLHAWLPYRRSGVLLGSRGDWAVVEGNAGYVQPLRPNGIAARDRWGFLGEGDHVANRWPGVAASLLPVGAGSLQLSGRLAAARYAPVSAALDAAGRPAGTRADARFELAVPVLLGGAVSFAPYVRGAAAGYGFESSQRSMGNAWGVGGAVLSTEISRRFGAVQHAIAPRIEWRAGTPAFGDRLPWLAYDGFDRSAAGLLSSGPPGAWSQLRVALATRLSRGPADLFRLEVGQDADLARRRFAETFVSLGGTAGPVAADAGARFLAIDGRPDGGAPPVAFPSPFLDRFAELRGNVSVSDARGDAVRAGLFSVGAGGSSTLVAGQDPLFDLRAAPFEAGAGMSAGVRAVLGGAMVGYDAGFMVREGDFACQDKTTRRVAPMRPSQHIATFVWNSPCRCFRILAYASINACGELRYDASIDISALASARPAP